MKKSLREEFIKEFCNDHNGNVRYLRNTMDTAEDEINWWLSKRTQELQDLGKEIEGERQRFIRIWESRNARKIELGMESDKSYENCDFNIALLKAQDIINRRIK